MRDEINEVIDDDSNVDADTSLADLNIPRLARIENDVNTGRIETNGENKPSLFAANNILRKTADNLAKAEAMIDEKPMRTEKTAELERKEEERDKE